jgi:hypothetical protein
MVFLSLVNFEGGYDIEANEIRKRLSYAVFRRSRWVEWTLKISALKVEPDI